MELYQLAYVMYHEAVSRDSGTSANYQQMQDQLGLDITSLSLVHGEIVAKRSQKKKPLGLYQSLKEAVDVLAPTNG